MVAHHLTADLQRLHLAHVNADGGVELEGPSSGGDLGVAVHHAHLFPELVDKDHDAVGLGDGTRQLPQCLAHQPGQQAYMGVAHVPFDLGPRGERGHRVHHHHVDGAGAHQSFTDLQPLLAGVRLRNQHRVDVHPQSAGI